MLGFLHKFQISRDLCETSLVQYDSVTTSRQNIMEGSSVGERVSARRFNM